MENNYVLILRTCSSNITPCATHCMQLTTELHMIQCLSSEWTSDEWIEMSVKTESKEYNSASPNNSGGHTHIHIQWHWHGYIVYSHRVCIWFHRYMYNYIQLLVMYVRTYVRVCAVNERVSECSLILHWDKMEVLAKYAEEVFVVRVVTIMAKNDDTHTHTVMLIIITWCVENYESSFFKRGGSSLSPLAEPNSASPSWCPLWSNLAVWGSSRRSWPRVGSCLDSGEAPLFYGLSSVED